MIVLHYHNTGEWLPDVWAQEKQENKAPGEIGGCLGIEVRYDQKITT
jgi:hypothetical protein